MEKESDYIKRSIELNKYVFSSSAALLLIIIWKTLTEIDVLTKIRGDWFLSIMTISMILGVGYICCKSWKKWTNLVEELK
jgi:hypothetical protein